MFCDAFKFANYLSLSVVARVAVALTFNPVARAPLLAVRPRPPPNVPLLPPPKCPLLCAPPNCPLVCVTEARMGMTSGSGSA